MNDLSVEYAHIYTNEHVREEQELSLTILNSVRENRELRISLAVMIDDYSFPDPSFDYASFTRWLTERGHSPDIVFRESQLIPLCDEVIKLLDNTILKKELGDYVRSKKYPCSLFIAAWYLLRLGHLSSPLFNEGLVSRELLNILPLSFKPFEDRGLEIIKATPFASSVTNIKHTYFDGRPIS